MEVDRTCSLEDQLRDAPAAGRAHEAVDGLLELRPRFAAASGGSSVIWMFETWWLVAANVRSSPTAMVVAIAAAPTIVADSGP